MPQIILTKEHFSLATLSFVPYEMARKYQVAAFASDNSTIKIAIVYPDQLKAGFEASIRDLGQKIGKRIVFYQTNSGSMQYLLKEYKRLKNPNKDVPAPSFKLGKYVAFGCLKKIPFEFANEYKLVCVDFAEPNQYWFAYAAKQEKVIARLIKVVEDENAIAARLIKISDKEFDQLLNHYRVLIREETEEKIEQVIQEEAQANPEQSTEAEHELVRAEKVIDVSEVSINAANVNILDPNLSIPIPPPPAVGQVAQTAIEKKQEADENPEIYNTETIVTPEAQGEILSTEDEQGGIGGFFQRLSKGLLGGNKEEAEKPETETPETPEPTPVNVPSPAMVVPEVPTGRLLSQSVEGSEPVKEPETEKSNDEKSVAKPANSSEPAKSQITGLPGLVTTTVPLEPVPNTIPAPAVTIKPNTPNRVQGSAINSEDAADIGTLLPKQVESIDELRDYIKKGQIPRIVAAIVSFAINQKASDIHIEAFDEEVRVRYRVDGQLMDILKMPSDLHAAMVSRIKILSKLRLDENRIPQDGRFDVNFNNAQVDLRVSVMPTVHGEKVVMRILDKSKGVQSLDKLGIMGLAYENLYKSIIKPFGICLATGPTGSGKSTSLYAILNQIATDNVNVITLEDPVEYEMKGINQSQVRPKIGFSFAEGLRSVLRQDPNIIMVGEIRDGETANMTTQAALTGHLVLSTLHTNDACGSIPRMTNMGIEPFLIASSLNMAMGQRLVRKICTECKSEVNLPEGVKQKFITELADIKKNYPKDAYRVKDDVHFYQGTGCKACQGSGYKGRMGIYEVLVMSDKIEELTIERATNLQIQEQAQKEGMLTMYQDGLLKVIDGVTTLDEVLRETAAK